LGAWGGRRASVLRPARPVGPRAVGRRLGISPIGAYPDTLWASPWGMAPHPFVRQRHVRTARLWTRCVTLRYGLPPFVRLTPHRLGDLYPGLQRSRRMAIIARQSDCSTRCLTLHGGHDAEACHSPRIDVLFTPRGGAVLIAPTEPRVPPQIVHSQVAMPLARRCPPSSYHFLYASPVGRRGSRGERSSALAHAPSARRDSRRARAAPHPRPIGLLGTREDLAPRSSEQRVDLFWRDKEALKAFDLSALKQQHVTLAEEAFCPIPIEDYAGVGLRRQAE